ncbi:MAG: GIY-YIG nuclease family protein [Cryomorphaceae bacterium]
MEQAFVYIIFSAKWDQYYIGLTENIEARVEYHNAGKNKSTRGGAPWKLAYREEFDDATSARKREYQIKAKKRRKYIQWFLSANRYGAFREAMTYHVNL